MAQIQNFTWDEGADLVVALNYKEGATPETAVLIDLTSGYSVRMDLVVPSTKERIYTFNSADIADVDPIASGAQPDTLKEGVLSSGADGKGNIKITVPRTLTLPGGAVYTQFATGVKVFGYDVFLRNTGTDKQSKILTGTVTVADSWTLWV